MIPLLDIPRLHASFQQDLELVFKEISSTGTFINGAAIDEFEKKLSNFTHTKFAVATGSGTDSLMLSLMALGVKPGDEIITTPYTFFSTAGSIARLGAVPVFVDIEESTFNIDTDLIKNAVTDKTVGIIPVHLFGNCADMTAINSIAKKAGLFVIEDAAQAIGAKHNGNLAGTMGDVAIFSFFPAKNLGALGDAGGVVTNNQDIYNKMKALRSHGAVKKYHHTLIGGNFRMDTIQAAMLNIKFKYLDRWTADRRKIADFYIDRFAKYDSVTLPDSKKNFHVYNQFVLRTDEARRKKLITLLTDAKIGHAVYYPVPLHLQPCFDYLGYKKSSFTNAEQSCLKNIALPIDPNLHQKDLEYITATVKKGLV